jgi:hypothetical protein
MSLTLSQNYTAVGGAANFAQFVGEGGTAPYTYSIVGTGAGGTVGSSTGVYTAPVLPSSSPNGAFDTIQVTDATSATATGQILVAYPIGLMCDIIQTGMGLDIGRVYEWNQKVFAPIDYGLYVVLTVQSCRPFGNSFTPLATDGSMVLQWVSMYAHVDIDIISRGPAARDQKELVIMTLNSIYSQQQQQANGFYIGKLPIMGGFINLSNIDGAAIPYRYKISYALQYQQNLTSSVPYFDTFQTEQIITNP